jgi:hypothetical protein
VRRIEKIFEEYKGRTDLHKLSNVDAAAQVGVSGSTISRWNISLGLSSGNYSISRHNNRPLIEADKDLGLVPDWRLARKYDCSRYLVMMIRREKGIPPCRRARKELDHIPCWMSPLFDRWKRPAGLSQHLEELYEKAA